METCINLAKKVLKGINAECMKLNHIDRGVVLWFKDNKTDRKYRVMVTEETEEALDYNVEGGG